ncbi:hypothetical protein CRUP_010213 [Coryphaenoides rupestris]|nr:hypothetical protein CRUP_010213 [Coryphaenoides rupestris]
MKEATPVTSSSSSTKSHHKVVKCTVYLDILSVTCPGALLAQPEDVYLSVCVMGQYQKTRCVAPVFPLRFRHKMLFVRMFPGVVDPADVSEQLESDTSTFELIQMVPPADTSTFELIQMVPPEGEILATVDECTRDFVFPGPRLTSSAEAPERQLLMRKSSSFPGIAPVVEFATTAVVEEMDGAGLCGLHPAVRQSPTHPGRRSPVKTASPPPCSKSPIRSPATPQRARGHRGNCGPSNRGGTSPPPLTPASPRRHGSQRTRNQEVRGQRSSGPPRSSPEVAGYQRPTAASVSRALSPYTHRRMCELSEDARARLGHLQLGPHRFRKQTESQPPFLVQCCSDISESLSYQRVSTPGASSLDRSGPAHFTAGTPLDSSLLGSYRPKQATSPDVPDQTVTPRGQTAWSSPGASSSRGPLSLGNPSLKERSTAGSRGFCRPTEPPDPDTL